MDLPALYEEDMYAWCLHQAEVLRRLKASSVPLPNELDLEHVAEEIEDLGNEQRFQAESNLEQALIHLIKVAVLPESDAVAHWLDEADAFLGAAAKRWRPSMRRAIDLPGIWQEASRRAGRILARTATPLPLLPADLPFTLDDLLDRSVEPRDLATRLAAAIAAT